MSEILYKTIEITDLKDMLNKTKKLYGDKPAYKIKIEDGKYKIFSHKEVRNMVDSLGTALIDMGLKGKRIAVIGENRYEWEIAYLSIVCGTGIVVPIDKSLPEKELETEPETELLNDENTVILQPPAKNNEPEIVLLQDDMEIHTKERI